MPSALAALDRAVDTKSGFISGVASSPAIDAYGHSVRRGAFDASIAKRGLSGPSSVKLLEGHQGLPVGRITRLHTVGSDLRIEAELNMDLSRARDLHSIIKHSGGLNFSVGFRLEDFDIVEEKKLKPGEPWLIVKRGDLTEVSVVTFPACASATMDVKTMARPLSSSLSPALVVALADWNAFVSRADANNAALMRKVVEIRRILDKRDRDEETLRQWRHEYVDGPRGRLNI
jgi:HK97 family phage prohead protease